MAQLGTFLIIQAIGLLATLITTGSGYSRTGSSCFCNTLNARNEFLCKCSDYSTSDKLTTPLSTLPGNLSGPFKILIGDAYMLGDDLLGYDTDCPRREMLQLSPAMYFPPIDQTNQISLFNFDFGDDRGAQINRRLSSVKANLTRLDMLCGALKVIDHRLLDGFDNLLEFRIMRAGLQHVDHGSFDGLVALDYLDLTYNNIKTFDWSLLQASALTLFVSATPQTAETSVSAQFISFVKGYAKLHNYDMRIDLDYNNMSQTYTSQPITFPILKVVGLDFNQLRSIPQDVIATWSTVSPNNMSVFVDGNPLCPMDNLCRCCSLQPLLQFAQETQAWVGNLILCGDYPAQRFCGVKDIRRPAESPVCENDCWTGVAVTQLLKTPQYYDRCKGSIQLNATTCIMP